MNAQELSWAYLIMVGSVTKLKWNSPEWCTYSSDYTYSEEKTNECLGVIIEHGIDFQKSGEPSDGFRSAFNGTFAEASKASEVITLEGKLFLKNGDSYNWACKFDEPKSVFKVLEMFYNINSINQIVKERLLKIGAK